MAYVEFMKARLGEIGIPSCDVHSDTLVTIDITISDDDPVTVYLMQRGETIRDEPILELFSYTMQPTGNDRADQEVARTLLFWNGFKGKLFHWGMETINGEDWFVAYARLIIPGMTASALESAIGSVATARSSFYQQVERIANSGDQA